MLCDRSKTSIYTGSNSGLIVYSTKTEKEVEKSTLFSYNSASKIQYATRILYPIKSLYPIK